MTKNLKLIIYLFKIALIILSFGFIIYKLFYDEQFSQIYYLLKGFDESDILFLSLVCLLGIVNWAIEALKWKFLIRKIQKISLIQSLKSIFAGISISIFTPNRTGEFAGRVININPGQRINAIFSTFVGNIAQLMVTLIFGLSVLILFPNFIGNISAINYIPGFGFQIVSFCLILSLLFVFFNLKKAEPLLKKIKYIKTYKKFYSSFFNYNNSELLKVLLLSMFRYLTFILQFLLLFRIFEVGGPIIDLMLAIFLFYLAIAVIPTFAIAELGIRGSLAIFIIGMISSNTGGVLLASSAIWFINLAIPSLAGSIIIYRSKIYTEQEKI